MKIRCKKILAFILAGILTVGMFAGACFAATKDPTEIDVSENSNLTGKSVLFCGDSISYGQWDTVVGGGGWGTRIAAAYSMKSDNPSMGGYSISNIRGGRIIDQFKNYTSKQYDYVILQGGVNDAWGDINTGVVAEPGEMTNSYDLRDFDITTFAGGLEELFLTAKKNWPNAKIGYMTTFATPNSKGIGRTAEMDPYYAQAIKICEKWGINLLDLYHDQYVNDKLMAVKTYNYLKDPIHPNAKGYDRLAPYIADWMEKMVDNTKLGESRLWGKKALFTGDSISYGSSDSPQGRGWAGRIGDAYGMTVVNASSSGMPISTCRPNSMYETLVRNKGEYYDYVILHGGVNDAWDKAPVGEITDSFDYTDFDRSTFAGALEHFFYIAVKYWSYAKIGYIINFKQYSAVNEAEFGNLNNMEPYIDVAKKICDKWQVQYLDLYHDDYASKTLLETDKIGPYMADAVHPNAKGYDRLSPYIAEWMKCLSAREDTAKMRSIMDHINAITDENDEDLSLTAAAVEEYYSLDVVQRMGVYNKQKLEERAPAYFKKLLDLNGDEKITATDALMLLQRAVGKLEFDERQDFCADADGSGHVTSTDALIALQIAVGKLDNPPRKL